MQVRLEVSHKSGKKKTVHIHSDSVIGRSTDCSLRIASSEISRQHCKLTIIESGVLVRDLESANGTWVDGVMIPPNRDVALPPGSRLSIGPVQFVVHYESSNPAIEQPGSTVEMPVMRAVEDSDEPPAVAEDEIPAVAEEAAELLPTNDAQPADIAATVVTEEDEQPAADEEPLDSGAVAETETEFAADAEADAEEGEYIDDEELDVKYEDEEEEEEVDAELGDFFNQFDK